VRRWLERVIQNRISAQCFGIKGDKKGVSQMKKGILIAMLIIAVGLAGCGHYYDRDDRGYGRGRHDQDRGRDYEHRDRDNDSREHHR